MKKAYKNKRDQYKAEASELRTKVEMMRQANESVSKQFEDYKKKCKEDKEKRYSAIVYCTNCLHVNSVSIPPGVTIKEGDCVTCRVRNTLLPVVSYPGNF